VRIAPCATPPGWSRFHRRPKITKAGRTKAARCVICRRRATPPASKPRIAREAAPLDKRYLEDEVVGQYDAKRYQGGFKAVKSRVWIGVVKKVLRHVTGAQSIIDVPCGTGYLTEVVRDTFPLTIAADASPTMVRKALSKVNAAGLVADLEQLPLRNDAVDCVLNVRFMVHFGPEERTRFLSEMARVSRRYVLVNYNHRYNVKYALRRLRSAFGRVERKKVSRKASRRELDHEATAASLRVVKIFGGNPLLPFMNERWLVLLEKKPAS
jgi:ubiquinone/menaquinone biosynthesis C-methylase UbiE